MSKLKMNCGYCGRKCDLDKDFCIPQDSVYVCKSCYEWQNRVADLEAKLAESEEDVNKLKYIIGRLTYYLDRFNYAGEHPFYNTTREQDKISFALEQLEKVKEFVDNLDTPNVESICNEYMCDIEDYIDNQINELKEMK